MAFWYRLLHSLSLEQPSQSRDNIFLFTLHIFNINMAEGTYRDDDYNLYRKNRLLEEKPLKCKEPLRNQKNTQQKTTMNQKRWKAKGIFLDLDGTLVDSSGAYIEAGKIAFQAIKKKTPETKILLEIPRRIEQHLTIDDLTHGDTKEFMQIYLKAYYSATEAKTKLMPNIVETLQTLSEKAKLALITMRHCPNQVIQKELDYFGIAKYFTYIVTAHGHR